jgi:ferric-dicitrate binding protein FerR (iron transport regulator)
MLRQELNRLHRSFFALRSILLIIPVAWAGEYSHARVVRLSLVEGDVQVMTADQGGWQKAIVNTPMREGMSIATAQGRAEVEFEEDATARIADNTVLQFSEMALADGNRVTRLNLSQGTATIYTSRGHHDTFTVQAGKLETTVRDNAQLRVDVFEDGASVSVLKGSVEVAAAGASERVNKGQTLALRNDAPDHVVLERNPAPDTWDRWVADRENAIEAGRYDSLRYVSSPVSYGLYDLSYYGGWYSYPGYGNCWQPYGIGMGWSPYYYGTWNYLPGFGFTWISYEPWGWMPYHYGRWVFSPAYGWLWVPGYFHAWNPGAVHWIRTPGRIGWVPQAPHDQPGVTPQNLSHGVISNTTTGLTTGQPHSFGPLAPGESPRFVADPGKDEEFMRTAAAIKAAPQSSATATDTRASAFVNAPPRKMSEREITTTPARIFTVAPTAPTAPRVSVKSPAAPSGAPSGATRSSTTSSAPRPSHSSSASSSSGRSERSAPVAHPAPHPPSSRPR